MSQASIAIIMPVYKPDFLRDALDSIASQSCRDFHVYVSDDCSPHDLKSIVDSYTDKIPLTYHRFRENAGGADLVAHWKRSIALSVDEPYIWLFSDDDIIGKDCIADFMALPKQLRDNSLVHFNLNVLDSSTGTVTPAPDFTPKATAEEFLISKLSGRWISYVVEFIFPRKLYDKCGGFENFDLAWGSDFMTWIKMASFAPGGIATVQSPSARVTWRKSDKNISPDSSYPIIRRKLNSLIDNAVFLRKFMEDNREKFPTTAGKFRWLRFPLGEIFRKRRLITYADIRRLCSAYGRKTGFQARAELASVLSMAAKSLKR